MYVIGVDIGTGSTKAVAMDTNGKVLIGSQVPYPTMNTMPGVSEQDPETIWSALVKCIQRITSSLNPPPLAISLSSAMHSILCVDNSGKPLSNLITWADNRSSAMASNLRNSSLGKTLYAKTGTPIHAMSPLCKLLWLKEENADLFNTTHKFISIKEYCWYKMFKSYEVDYSIASATGLFNIHDLRWDSEALAHAGITEDRLSVIVNTNYFRTAMTAEVAANLNVEPAIKVFIGGSDGCLANVGSFATSPGIAALTIGTSGAIRVAGLSPAIDYDTMPFNYRLDESTFVSGGPINNGGVALKWYAESLLKKPLLSSNDYNELLSALRQVPPGSDGLVFLPYIFGERAPVWDSDTCGVFFGITVQHKQEHFTKAVVEGITFSLYQIARSLQDRGLNIDEVHVSGGFVRSYDWVQLLANVFGKRCRLMNIEDASAIGAAIIAIEAMQLESRVRTQAEQHAVVFEPDLREHEVYQQKYFPVFQHLYGALTLEMKIFHENRREDSLQTNTIKQ